MRKDSDVADRCGERHFQNIFSALLLASALVGCAKIQRAAPPPEPSPPSAAAAEPGPAPAPGAVQPVSPTRSHRVPSSESPAAVGNPVVQPSAANTRPAVNLLPMLRIETDAVVANDASSKAQAQLGAYSRFYVVAVHPPHQPLPDPKLPGSTGKCDATVGRCYAQESRPGWQRMMMGRELARVLSVKIDLRNPSIATTTTLASASYESTFSRGESWTTELNGKLLLTPYFRIGSNSVARVEASINASAKGKDQVSGKLLAILQTASELVAPTSALLTSLNAPRLNQASQFVEQSLSGMFSNAVVEKSSNEFDPASWAEDRRLVTIHAEFPMSTEVTTAQTRHIGTWEIRAATPIISIFSNIATCAASTDGCDQKQRLKDAFADFNASEVLNFPVAENLTLRQAMITDSGVLNALDDLNKGTGVAEAGLAGQLCRRLDERAQALGFNRYDAAAIVWAFSQSAGMEAAKGERLRGAGGGYPAAAIAAAVLPQAMPR